MKKRHFWPQGHWNWPIDICHKHGVHCGEMIWVGGQVDLSPDGVVLNPGDLNRQTESVMRNIERVLFDAGGTSEDLINLNCFYVNTGSVDEQVFLDLVAGNLGADTRTALTAVPVPYLAYPGMEVEIEAVAMRKPNGEQTTRQHVPDHGASSSKFCDGIRSGKLIIVSAQAPVDANGNVLHKGNIVAQTQAVMGHISRILDTFGADFKDVVKLNRWYKGDVGIEDFEPASLACAAYFTEPGPAATGIPLPRHADPEVMIKIGVIAMLGENGESLPRVHVWPDSLWDWHVHLPYKHGLRCEDMIFLGGQVSLDKQGKAVHPGDLSAQTHQAMTHVGTILNELGAGYGDVCKVLAFYQGDCGPEALNANLPIRSSYFDDPGPATTGVPLPGLAYPAMNVEIDIYAMVDHAHG